MKKINFTHLGGFPLTQNRLSELQDRDDELKNALLVALGIDLTNTTAYIIKGLELSGSTYSDGWIVYLGNVYEVTGGVGGYLHFVESATLATFEDLNDKVVYTYTTAVINNISTGSPLDVAAMIRLTIYSNLTMPTATETQLGAIKLAHQQAVDVGIDDTRAVTPLKLKNTNFIPNILHTATIYLGTIAQYANVYAVTFPNVGTGNYRIVGYVHTTGVNAGQLTYSIVNQTATGFSLAIHCLNTTVANAYFFFTIYKNN